MERIYYNGQYYTVIDETDGHYICIKDGATDPGYYLLSKQAAAEAWF